jgi:hypothetical protein
MNKKTKLVGILYSNDVVEVVKLNKLIKSEIEDCDEIYKYKKSKMYLSEDVVYCVGEEKEKIKTLLNDFNNDQEVKEYFNML